MKTTYLFPHRYRSISSIIFLASFITLIGFYVFDQFSNFEIKAEVFAIAGSGESSNFIFGDDVYFSWVENSVTDEILMCLTIIAGVIFAFSKEKHEDEMVAAIRLHSLAWATIVNYAILLLSYLLIFDIAFLNVLMAAMFTQLIIFIILFRFKMYGIYRAR
jgi:hypothetical protein